MMRVLTPVAITPAMVTATTAPMDASPAWAAPTAYAKDELCHRVATGRDNKTPVGTFKITDKIMHPTWHRSGGAPVLYGDPANPLGTHWLAIDLPGYGLHGTWEPDQLGAQTSDGCVRLLNDHIEELYTILPKGTLVTITD